MRTRPRAASPAASRASGAAAAAAPLRVWGGSRCCRCCCCLCWCCGSSAESGLRVRQRPLARCSAERAVPVGKGRSERQRGAEPSGGRGWEERSGLGWGSASGTDRDQDRERNRARDWDRDRDRDRSGDGAHALLRAPVPAPCSPSGPQGAEGALGACRGGEAGRKEGNRSKGGGAAARVWAGLNRENCNIVRVGRDLKAHPVPPCPGQGHLPLSLPPACLGAGSKLGFLSLRPAFLFP